MPFGMELGLSPGDFVLDGDPASPPQKGGGAPQNFRSMFIGPNGWMDQDGTWHGGRPQRRRHCVRWGPSSPPQKGGRHPPQFSAHLYYGQTAGCIKMSLVMEVGLIPGYFVLDGDPPTLNFRPMFIIVIVISLEHCTVVVIGLFKFKFKF